LYLGKEAEKIETEVDKVARIWCNRIRRDEPARDNDASAVRERSRLEYAQKLRERMERFAECKQHDYKVDSLL
jgi:hypothetical protein